MRVKVYRNGVYRRTTAENLDAVAREYAQLNLYPDSDKWIYQTPYSLSIVLPNYSYYYRALDYTGSSLGNTTELDDTPEVEEVQCPDRDDCHTCDCCSVCLEHDSCDCSTCESCSGCREHGSCDCYYCERCNSNIHRGSWCSECDRCTDCCNGHEEEEEERGPIAEYHSHKGQFQYCAHSVPYYLGFELEVECGSSNASDKAEAFLAKVESRVVLESDGSLDNGFEIISHPLCPVCAYEAIKDVAKVCRDISVLSYDANTCGFHVHVSRKYFSRGHLERLEKFMSSDNTGLLCKVARRNAERWAKIEGKKWGESSDERYRALNLNNTRTVEFRLFRGTTIAVSLEMYLQFVECAVAFTKVAGFSQLGGAGPYC